MRLSVLISTLCCACVTVQGAISGVGGSGIALGDATNVSTFVVTNSLSANYVVAGGDSRLEETNCPACIACEWPRRLLSEPNWSYMQSYNNFGLGGSTSSNWSAFGLNLYSTTAHLLSPAVTGKKSGIFLFECGVNDMGTFGPYITNFILNVWQQARADGYIVVATTITTQTVWSAANSATGMAVNAQIRLMGQYYDYLLDLDRLVTNGAAQLKDGTHYTAATAQNIADYMGTNYPAPVSQKFSRMLPTLDPTFRTLTSSNVARVRGFMVTGPTLGPNTYGGAGLYLDYDSASGNGVISDHNDDGSAYLPLYIRGSLVTFDQLTSVAIPSGTFTLGALGAGVTNIYATNFTLDFPNTFGISNFDAVVTIPGGCSSNDLCLLQVPATLQLPRTAYTAFTSNGTVFIRYSNYNTNQAVDPPVGMVNLLLFKR